MIVGWSETCGVRHLSLLAKFTGGSLVFRRILRYAGISLYFVDCTNIMNSFATEMRSRVRNERPCHLNGWSSFFTVPLLTFDLQSRLLIVSVRFNTHLPLRATGLIASPIATVRACHLEWAFSCLTFHSLGVSIVKSDRFNLIVRSSLSVCH